MIKPRFDEGDRKSDRRRFMAAFAVAVVGLIAAVIGERMHPQHEALAPAADTPTLAIVGHEDSVPSADVVRGLPPEPPAPSF